MSNSSSFQKAIFLSLNLTHIWFWKTTLDFEKNPQHFFSATLIKFRNLSLITHLIRLLIVALSIVFFTIFRFHRELIAFVLDSLMIFEGIYATLKINECLIKMHRFALISLFLFKVIMVWVDLFSTLILSWIFHWKAEVVIFIVLQVVFLVCDVTPAYSIYLLYQNEINDCMEESHHIIAEMVFLYKCYVFLD